MADFFYDNQIRRFIVQFARIFSNWQVTKGKDPQGNDILVRVPIQYGDSSRMVSAQIANNSPSSLPSAPLITYYVSGFEYDQKRTQDPYFIDKIHVRQRAFNTETQTYEQVQGQAFTVERIMPVPYTLSMTVEFWTTNYQQKLEILEQIGVLFNPALEIQSTDNFIDWTSLSVVYQDGLTFSGRSIPVGTSNPIDVMTWKFYMPIWISGPAKIKKLGVVQKLVASIFKSRTPGAQSGNGAGVNQGNNDYRFLTDMQDSDLLLGTRQKVTPFGYKVLLLGNSLQILPSALAHDSDNHFSVQTNPDLNSIFWNSILTHYGTIRPGISQIWLQNPYMDNEIVGTITQNPIDDRLLIYDIDTDTLPQNTLSPVDSIINPQTKGPGEGLPPPALNQRYLLVDDIGSEINDEPSIAWGSIVANANDIIQYNGSKWVISFKSSTSTNVDYVTNLTTKVQYRHYDGVWVKAYEGFYEAGDFSIVI